MDQLLEYKAVIIAAWLIGLFALERALPAAAPAADVAAREGWRGWRRILRNLGMFLANGGLSFAVVVPVSLWAAHAALGWRPDWWSGPFGLLLDLLILDLWIYFWHRANHEIPFLWRFHEVHHLDRFLDVTSAVRFHFGEVMLSAVVRAALIIALGMPIESVIVFEIVVLSAAAFHHANIRLPRWFEAGLSRVIVTPSLHWIHHRRSRAETDSNYGVLFSLWDRLFGTLSPTPRALDMPIGVEGRDERGFVSLMTRPIEKP